MAGAISKAGKPAALVKLLVNGNFDAKEFALWSLWLSISSENQAIVMEAGGVQPLIDQLANGNICIQAQAAGAIAKLAYRNDETQAAIIECGGVRPLIGLLDLSGESTASGRVRVRVSVRVRDCADLALWTLR